MIAWRVLQVGLGCGLCMLAWAGQLGSVSNAEGLLPGVYGRVSEWGEQPPPVLNEQPVQVRKTAGPPAEPIYLNVPTAERRHWPQHCARHRACAAPVYFVDAQRWARTLARRAEPAASPVPTSPVGEAASAATAE